MIYYKYFKANRDRVADIFQNKQVYFASRDQLNDPFEGRPNIAIPKNPTERLAIVKTYIKINPPSNPPQNRKERERLVKDVMIRLSNPDNVKKILHDVSITFGIFSISTKYDDILMWAHYAESHRGLCLGFQFDDYIPGWGPLLKITYSECYPLINLEQYLQPIKYPNEDPDAPYRKTLLTKSSHWVYEDEHRFIRLPSQGGAGKYQFPINCLKQIILGAEMLEADKVFFKELAGSYEQHIQIFEAKISETEYKVVIPGLNDKSN